MRVRLRLFTGRRIRRPDVAAAGHVDVVGLRELQRALKRFAPGVHKSFRKRLREIAKVVAADARGRASWSHRIPGAIQPFVTMKAAGVRVRAAKAQHGPLYEGGDQQRATFRHPLFGDRSHWYTQRTRPFLHPAVEARARFIHAEAVKAVEEAKREVEL